MPAPGNQQPFAANAPGFPEDWLAWKTDLIKGMVQAPHIILPTSTLIPNGSIWTTTSGLYARINGATVGPFIQTESNAITGWTQSLNVSSPNNTVNASRFLASGGTTDQDAVIQPKGQGAIQAQLADGGTGGGDKRGIWATDFQMTRGAANQVASGQSAFTCGEFNRATGTRSAVIGGDNHYVSGTGAVAVSGSSHTIAGNYAVCLGGTSGVASAQGAVTMGTGSAASATDAIAVGQYGIADATLSFVGGSNGTARAVARCFAWGGAQYNYPGTYQRRRFVLCARTTDATPTVMTTDVQAAAATNQVNADANGGATKIRGQVVAHKIDGADVASWDFSALMKNVGGTTTLVGAATITAGPLDAGAATWTLGITVDDTNNCFVFTATGQAAKTISWTAEVNSAEAGT